jgi:ribosomal protein L32
MNDDEGCPKCGSTRRKVTMAWLAGLKCTLTECKECGHLELMESFK